MNNEDIVAGLLRGSPAAADALIDQFGPPLTRYFSVHLPDPAQAEDMVQEVFLRLLGTLRRTTHHGQSKEIRSLYSLLFTIARHLAIDVRKSAGRKPQVLSLDEELGREQGSAPGPVMVHLADHSPDPRQRAATEQRHKQIEEAIHALPPEYRDVLVLRHIEELNGRQIAEILGIREGTVWSRLSRALQELRNTLTSFHEAGNPPHYDGGASSQSAPMGGAR